MALSGNPGAAARGGRDAEEPLPAAGVLISPWVDVSEAPADPGAAAVDTLTPAALARFRDAYVAGGDARDPRASPAYAALTGLPPLLVQVGEIELLRPQGEAFAARGRGAGVAVDLDVAPHMMHVWHHFAALLPAGAEAIGRIADFLRRAWR